MNIELAKLEGKPEIFYTLQGEGKSMGQPAVFCRLSTCNLYCSWCDTPYTWNWSNTPYEHKDGVKYVRKEHTLKLATDEVVRILSEYPCKRIVFTGGEPMLQQKQLALIMEGLRAIDPAYIFEVETNATKPVLPALAVIVTQFNCSPKMQNSGNEKKVRETEALKEYVALPQATFKFVCSSWTDFEEVVGFTGRYGIAPSRVFIMPEGRTPDEIGRNARTLAEKAKEQGFMFTTRLHVILWGAKRGV